MAAALIAVFGLVLALVGTVPLAHAATITVNSTGGDVTPGGRGASKKGTKTS